MRLLAFITGGMILIIALFAVHRASRSIPSQPEQPVAAQTPRPAPIPNNNTLKPPALAGQSAAGVIAAPVQPPAKSPRAVPRWNLTAPGNRERLVTRFKDDAEKAKREAWTRARDAGWEVFGTNADGSVFELMAIRNGRPIYHITLNQNAAISTAADVVLLPLYDARGGHIRGGIWDQGSVRQNHREFATNRVTVGDGAAAAAHSTHVGGTMIAAGVDPAASGMAPAARLISFDWNSDYSEMVANAAAAAGETNLLQISNHSYGPICGWYDTWWYGTWGAGYRESDYFGSYDTEAEGLDILCYNAPYYLPFQAAGNDRIDPAPSAGMSFRYLLNGNWLSKIYNPATDPLADNWDQGGYDTLLPVAAAKNIMTIGSVNDAVIGGLRNLDAATMTDSSSWGPADDGRIKPDIVANGDGLYSAGGHGATTYAIMSGTSMACANASGSTLLILDFWRSLIDNFMPRASTLKGLIIHSADDLGRPGPDYMFGWGLMNVRAAFDLVRRQHDLPHETAIIEDKLDNAGAIRRYPFAWNTTGPIKVTLCWTDPPGMATNGLDITTPTLVNDLDLRLVGPDGTPFPPFILDPAHPTNNAATGDNKLDPVEQVLLQAPTSTGIYAAIVSAKGDFADGEQQFSLIISGIGSPPRIAHTPLANTWITNAAYRVEANVAPGYVADTGTIELVWWLSGQPGATTTNRMLSFAPDRFIADITPQPAGTVISYYLRAASRDGFFATLPAGAPGTFFSFAVTPAVHLTITASPPSVGSPTPSYGTHDLATGILINATADAITPPAGHMRYRCAGWSGSGDIPPTGASNSVGFCIRSSSILKWKWAKEYELEQISSPAGIIATSTWWTSGALTGRTAIAVGELTSGGTGYCFTGWTIVGQRQTNASGRALNPATGIAMTASKVAVAVYLAADRDDDGDGLSDWWEMFYFGSLDPDPADDPDGDWFTNEEEFLDRSDPGDGTVTPAPPVIAHVPLANPQAHPAPWPITAMITDTVAVAEARLLWRRNRQSAWRQVVMQALGDGHYTADIPPPGANGDAFQYSLRAVDLQGYATQTIAYAFTVAYPLWSLQPGITLGTTTVRHATITNFPLTVINTGRAALCWSSAVETRDLEESFEVNAGGFTHGGPVDRWNRSTNRAASGQYAWYCGVAGTRLYQNSMNASLDTPPVAIRSAASLAFKHWIRCEYDKGSYYWDGGVVEISTDAGTNFNALTPAGGYPSLITPNPASPFPGNTPCYGNTGGWLPAIFDLAPYAGHTAIIRFRFGSDGSVTDEGWYIDDVRIVSPGAWSNWLTLVPATGVLGVAKTTNLTIRLDANGTRPGADYRAAVAIAANDPFAPTCSVTCAMRDRTQPVMRTQVIAQTSTNGEGLITISNRIACADGSPCAVRFSFRLKPDCVWSNAWIEGATASCGAPLVSNGEPRQVHSVCTWSNDAPITNLLVITWNTRQAPAIAGWSTNFVIRTEIASPWLDSKVITSKTFMVDNAGPGAAKAVVELDNLQDGLYVLGGPVRVRWRGFRDPGGGIRHYQYGANSGEGCRTTTATNAVLDGLRTNAMNAVLVRAVDTYGNVSRTITNFVVLLSVGGDMDHDGALNDTELIAGTDPADRSKSPDMRAVTALSDATGYLMSWLSATGRHYTVEFRNMLNGNSGQWNPVPGAAGLHGTGGVMTWRDTNILQHTRYFRLIIANP